MVIVFHTCPAVPPTGVGASKLYIKKFATGRERELRHFFTSSEI
jgi:hypothetical protein